MVTPVNNFSAYQRAAFDVLISSVGHQTSVRFLIKINPFRCDTTPGPCPFMLIAGLI